MKLLGTEPGKLSGRMDEEIAVFFKASKARRGGAGPTAGTKLPLA